MAKMRKQKSNLDEKTEKGQSQLTYNFQNIQFAVNYEQTTADCFIFFIL